jgi:putative DNA primase/helicase
MVEGLCMNLYEAIAAVGYAPPETIVWDAKIHRFATDPDRAHSKDGWYIAHDDAKGKAAAFGSWRDDSQHTWSNGTGREFTQAERQAMDRAQAKAKKDVQIGREQTALRAQRLYEQATAQVDHHAYLARKGIACPEGVRAVQGLPARAFGFDGDWTVNGLLVPMRDRKGDIRSLQLIPADASYKKLFLPGGQTAAAFHHLGEIDGAGSILIAEGLATAQSLREATGLPSVVAFSAGNLTPVAEAIRGRNATAEIVLCGDDDEAGRRNSEKAANACNGRIVYPGGGVNDFNDLHAAKGLDAVRVAVLGKEEEENEDWRAELVTKHKTDGVQTTPCLVHNLILIFHHSKEFSGRIRLNEFTNTNEIDGKEISDGAFARLKAQLENGWMKGEKVISGDIKEAIDGLDDRCSYHPVRDYLSGQRWDGISRIEEFFPDYLETPNDPYHRGVGKAFFISAAGRIFNPGMKADLMAIVEGSQGKMKSTMWATLGGEWYADITDDINNKDFQAGLQGVWIADLGELDHFGKADSSRVKAIVTICKDRLRRPYAKFHQTISRQTILVGSSNRTDWLNDPTGGRRFLPVSCVADKINIPSIAAARDQLWAEAAHRFKSGEQGWWDVPDAAEHQAARYSSDPWQEPIERWLLGRTETTSFEILSECIRIELGKQTKSDWTRVGNVMVQQEDWERKRARFERGQKPQWRYVRRV